MSEKRITEENRYAGLALAEEELVARVAWCYYHDGLTQNDIGERLGLPRLKISRLLEKGRQSGVIRVQINSRYEGCLALESELQQRFGLKIARVLPALNTPPMNTRLGIGAAQSLMGILQPGQLLAVGFGEATMSCLQHLSGFIGSQQVRLVTLSGGVGPYMTGIGQLDAGEHELRQGEVAVGVVDAPAGVAAGDPVFAVVVESMGLAAIFRFLGQVVGHLDPRLVHHHQSGGGPWLAGLAQVAPEPGGIDKIPPANEIITFRLRRDQAIPHIHRLRHART